MQVNIFIKYTVFGYSVDNSKFKSNNSYCIVALANRQGQGGMADGMAVERNQNIENASPNINQNNVQGGNVGGVYQHGVSPAQAAAVAANNRVVNNLK